MNALHIVLALFIGWCVLVIFSLISIVRLLFGFVAGLLMRSGIVQPRRSTDINALDMTACPYCGVYTSGMCNNPECSGQK